MDLIDHGPPRTCESTLASCQHVRFDTRWVHVTVDTFCRHGAEPERTFDAIKQIDRHGGSGLLQERGNVEVVVVEWISLCAVSKEFGDPSRRGARPEIAAHAV